MPGTHLSYSQTTGGELSSRRRRDSKVDDLEREFEPSLNASRSRIRRPAFGGAAQWRLDCQRARGINRRWDKNWISQRRALDPN
jgi:hypothetical protein